MLCRTLATLAFIAALNSLFAQTTLFVPRNYQKPYERGTRSWDGKPGPNYWQNRAAYTIAASIDPKTRRLSGERNRYVYQQQSGYPQNCAFQTSARPL
jgi:hypothetical protein